MTVHDVRCPRCGGSLSVNIEQGLVQCGYCGSTLYVDADNRLKLNSEKVQDNLNSLFKQLQKDAVSNHSALIYGASDYGSQDCTVHFKEKPIKYYYNAKVNNEYDGYRIVLMILGMIVGTVFFYKTTDFIILPLFLGLLVGCPIGLVASEIIVRVIVFLQNTPFRQWESEQKEFYSKTRHALEKSKFVSLLSNDIILFYNSFIQQAQCYNIKTIRIQFIVGSKGCSLIGSVNCPHRDRTSNQLFDRWDQIYNNRISYKENDFKDLCVEEQDAFFDVIVKIFQSNTKNYTIKSNEHLIEWTYANSEFREPSFNSIW